MDRTLTPFESNKWLRKTKLKKPKLKKSKLKKLKLKNLDLNLENLKLVKTHKIESLLIKINSNPIRSALPSSAKEAAYIKLNYL